MKQHNSTLLLLTGFLLVSAAAHADVVTLSDNQSRPIADNDPAPAPLVTLLATTPSGAAIDNVEVVIELAHPWVGDVVILLRHGGVEATLINRLAIADFPFGCGGDNIDARFTDLASDGPDSQCSAISVPTVAGDVLPSTELAVFDGMDPAGAWEVVVADASLYDVGTLDNVSISISFTTSCQADLNNDGMVGSPDLAILLSAWGLSGVAADFDGSGVGSSDLAVLLSGWGMCP